MQSHSTLSGKFIKLIAAIGALTLMLTMVLVTSSAIGRHFGFPLPGNIEIVELLILITAAVGILIATIEKTHAAAKLIIDRFPKGTRNVIEVIGILLCVIFCVAMVIGNSWLLYDVWTMHEASHLLHIPIVPFRLFFIAALACTCAVLIFHLCKRHR